MDASFLKVRAGRPSRAAASSARSHVVVPVGVSPWISRRGDSGASPCLTRGKQDAAGRGLGVDLELEGGPNRSLVTVVNRMKTNSALLVEGGCAWRVYPAPQQLT